VPIFRKINTEFFKKWSPEMAYILGFLFADGNIVHTKRNTWFWSLQITDKNILVKIKETINSSHKISCKRKILNHKQLYRLQVGSKSMCADLISLGLAEQKSKTMIFPAVPDRYFSDFLRGYFDGDGGIWLGLKNKKSVNKIYIVNSCFTSGSEKFLVSLQDELCKRGISGGSLVKKERGFDLKFSIKNTLILYKIMYNSGIRKNRLFLQRKKRIFEKFMSLRS
jgi:hypothetical protein